MAGNDETWKILHSRSLIRDRRIDVRADACETPSGLRVDPYYVLTYPDWVAVVAITPDRQMVLVRQYRHAVGKVLLEAPAGSMEASDESPEAAARRELLEETGYRCERMEWLSSLYPNPSMQTNRVHAFLAHDVVRVDDQKLDAEEDGLTVELLPIETVLAGLGTGLIGQSMHVAAILQAMTVLPRLEPTPGAAAVYRTGVTPVPALSQPARRDARETGTDGAGMRVFGIDFTSAPSRQKPITCVECRLDGGTLRFVALHRWTHFEGFTGFLSSSGPWIAGLDFPFGQSRKFIETIGWPLSWEAYVGHVSGLSRAAFYEMLTAYRLPRAAGDKEHQRFIDRSTGGISPQKLHGVPVGLMFYEGARRLLASDVHLPLLRAGDPSRVAVEAYPGVMARRLIGRRSYKNDTRSLQTPALLAARLDLFDRLCDPAADLSRSGLRIEAPRTLADEPTADALDALLCAVQAGWAYGQKDAGFGIPPQADPLEGWIVDPALLRAFDPTQTISR
ncbi:NUDIX hydrolase [Rhizobium sp. Leaf371]|uniref:NUDIX hydrolase n=1 Tax=Rhizobium sp. Leaf371 TaxID=1736355 RepID=UPI000A4D9804|nr:NUDIX hydrolase [Rhizobium sp. Leaf371]